MQIVSVGDIPADERDPLAATVRQGKNIRQSLLRDDAPDGLSFTLRRSQWLPGDAAASSPRHRHAFQQIRWTESGRVNYGPGQYVEKGDFAYFPRAAYYGPQHRDEGIVLTLQFGFNGEKQHGVAEWEPYRDRALENLKQRGRFEQGQFVEIDPATGEEIRKDGVEAVYEEQYELRFGEKYSIAEPGYAEAILVHCDAFDYFELEPGVEMRRFGSFYDHAGPNGDLRLSMARLNEDGRVTLGADRAQIAWTGQPGLIVEGAVQPEMTFVYSELGEDVQVGGTGGVEVNLVEFPNLG